MVAEATYQLSIILFDVMGMGWMLKEERKTGVFCAVPSSSGSPSSGNFLNQANAKERNGTTLLNDNCVGTENCGRLAAPKILANSNYSPADLRGFG